MGRKPAVKNIIAHSEARDPLNSFYDDSSDERTAVAILSKDSRQVAQFSKKMTGLDLSEQTVQDLSYLNKLDQIERLHRLADQAMARRDSLLRDYEKRRDGKARRTAELSQKFGEVVDAVFE